MPNVKTLLIDTDLDRIPEELTLKVTIPSDLAKLPTNQIQRSVRTVLGTHELPIVRKTKIGLIYSCDRHEANGRWNPLATKILKEFNFDEICGTIEPCYGRCLVMGDFSREVVDYVDKKTQEVHTKSKLVQHPIRKSVNELYMELTDYKIKPGRSGYKWTAGPTKCKTALAYFQSWFSREHKARLAAEQPDSKARMPYVTQQARETWRNMSEQQKAPFYQQHQEDRARYEREFAEFRRRHPVAPRPIRLAHNFYAIEAKKTNGPKWTTLSPAQQKRWRAMEDKDRQRYLEEIEVYREYCERSGKDFDYEISKGRKRPINLEQLRGRKAAVKAKPKPKKKAKKAKAKPKKKKKEAKALFRCATIPNGARRPQ